MTEATQTNCFSAFLELNYRSAMRLVLCSYSEMRDLFLNFKPLLYRPP
jgi:hypothetical protein